MTVESLKTRNDLTVDEFKQLMNKETDIVRFLFWEAISNWISSHIIIPLIALYDIIFLKLLVNNVMLVMRRKINSVFNKLYIKVEN